MRKRLVLLLLMKLSGLLLHKADAQSRLSLENYYSMRTDGPAAVMPVASFQTSNNFYAEGRYNYEAANSFSFYMGRTFSKEATLSYSISPIAGAVMGDYNGGSFGANVSMGYKNFFLYIQPQYTFSLAGSVDNFAYSWTDLTYSPLNWLSVGVSLQHTKPQRSPGFLEGGLVVEAAYKNITFPVYMFNPHTKDRALVFGANFEVNFKKSKAKQRRESDSFKDVYPVNILASNPSTEASVSPKEEIKPAEPVVNVRRVNVVVRTKSEQTIIKAYNSEANKFAAGRAGQLKSKAAPDIPEVQQPRKTPPDDAARPGIIAEETETPVSTPAPASVFRNSSKAQPSSMQFALLLGPFTTENDALNIKSRLSSSFDREIIIYPDGREFKLRIPGFEDEKAAKLFSLNASSQGCKAAAIIVQYKLKSIDAIPLRNDIKPFEATKL